VTGTLFLVCFALGAAALALWALVRLPGFAPSSIRGALLHVGASLVFMHLAVPFGITYAADRGTTLAVLAGVLGAALPALTYVFVATLWALRVAQDAMPGLRR
jgi:uncharacterized membrane protein